MFLIIMVQCWTDVIFENKVSAIMTIIHFSFLADAAKQGGKGNVYLKMASTIFVERPYINNNYNNNNNNNNNKFKPMINKLFKFIRLAFFFFCR